MVSRADAPLCRAYLLTFPSPCRQPSRHGQTRMDGQERTHPGVADGNLPQPLWHARRIASVRGDGQGTRRPRPYDTAQLRVASTLQGSWPGRAQLPRPPQARNCERSGNLGQRVPRNLQQIELAIWRLRHWGTLENPGDVSESRIGRQRIDYSFGSTVAPLDLVRNLSKRFPTIGFDLTRDLSYRSRSRCP